ncbi:MAG TPA: hypothetical protein VJS65_05705, partial [Verrucomicrobiae bacterium]|nr:hypothetical protein [Verrucomicrobiae bacterium]
MGRRPCPTCANSRGWLTFIFLALVLSAAAAVSAEVSTNKPARIKVSGYGLFGNREMRRLLHELFPGAKLPPLIDRTMAEDAALLLLSRGHEEGYLHAKLNARFVMPDGTESRFVWTNAFDAILT